MSLLADYWAGRGHDVTLVTLDGSIPDFYQVSRKIERIRLLAGRSNCLSKPHWRCVRRLRVPFQLRKAISGSKPDAVVTFIDVSNILTLLVTIGMKVPVVISERVDPHAYRIPLVWRALRRALYPRASALVVQTHSVASWAASIVGGARAHVIANPIAPPNPELLPPGVELPPEPFAVAVGRLTHQKGFDLLIKAFALALRSHPDWSLIILGNGPEEEHLKHLAQDLGIRERVLFYGVTRGVEAYFRAGSLFVLSSRFEGFPNALLEAMAAGIPVIATDCPSGPGEIITNGFDGILVSPDDVGALHQKMEQLMADPALSARLAENGRAVSDRFSLATIGETWEGVLLSVTHQRELL